MIDDATRQLVASIVKAEAAQAKTSLIQWIGILALGLLGFNVFVLVSVIHR